MRKWKYKAVWKKSILQKFQKFERERIRNLIRIRKKFERKKES